jgi:hypothetical protein
MPDGFVSLADAFNKEPVFDGLRKKIKESDVVVDFYKIFPDFEKIAKPVKVDKQVLYLSVQNAGWRSELKFKEKIIIEKVNEYYKEERVKSLRFSSKV